MSAPSPVHLYIDGVRHKTPSSQLAGYSVFAPAHSVRIAEPLPGHVQSLYRAQLHAFLAALHLIQGLRARAAVICIHSDYIVKAYKYQLRKWHENGWRSENNRPIASRAIWQEVWDICSSFADRRVRLSVQAKNRETDHNMYIANRLARHATTLHVTCELCHRTHGRQWDSHDCKPICNLDGCRHRVFDNVEAYNKHATRRHMRKCRRKDCEEKFSTFVQKELEEHEREAHGGRVFACDYCGHYLKSARGVTRHVRNKCKHAPICSGCGKVFKSRKELEAHHRHIEASESSESSDGEERYMTKSAIGRLYRGVQDRDDDSEWTDSEQEEEWIRAARKRAGGLDGGRGKHKCKKHTHRHRSHHDDHAGGQHVMTDGEGREWEIDEFEGVRRRAQRPSGGMHYHTTYYDHEHGGARSE